MGRKVFVSYKYGDKTVCGRGKTVRDYVDELQGLLAEGKHVNRGEPNHKDLSKYGEDVIRKELADRIFDSTVTIVIISPNMREAGVPERHQWIPWEISYSLRTETRANGKSYHNAMLAVALPDANNSYGYYIEDDVCPGCDTTTLNTGTLFPILARNMFNIKNPVYTNCRRCGPRTVYRGESCYIDSVKWDDYKAAADSYIGQALDRQRNRDEYTIHTKLKK